MVHEGTREEFALVGAEYTHQCPCLMDTDGSVDQVLYALQLSHTSGARFRCDVLRSGGTLASLTGKHFTFETNTALTDGPGVAAARRVLPSLAGVVSDTTLAASAVCVGRCHVQASMPLEKARELAQAATRQPEQGSSAAEHLHRIAELQDGVVFDDCHACVSPGNPLHAVTAVPLPTGVSDFALTSAGEEPTCQTVAATSRGRGRLRRPRKRPAASHPPPPAPSGHRDRILPAPLTKVVHERLKDGMEVAWVAVRPQGQGRAPKRPRKLEKRAHRAAVTSRA